MTQSQYVDDFDSDRSFHQVLAVLLDRPIADTKIADSKHGHALVADWISTPLGPMIAVVDEKALLLLEFFDRTGLAGALKKLQKTNGTINLGRHPVTDQIEHELSQYFIGKLHNFTTTISQPGSDFARDVWQALTDIPPGITRSYQSLAEQLGRPSAVRAVARANGANNVAVAVPCHRLIGSNGSLTGYGGGLWRKQWLIDHEQQVANTLTDP